MATSTEQLNDAIAALKGAADAYNGKKGEIDAALASAQAGFTALSGDLKGVVNERMHFTATIDPDEPNPTDVDGGTFLTAKQAIEAAPSGAWVLLNFARGKVHQITSVVSYAQALYFRPIGSGEAPILDFPAFSTGAYNQMHTISMLGEGVLNSAAVDFSFPVAKAEDALPWSSQNSAIRYGEAIQRRLYFASGKVSGGESCALLRAGGGSIAQLSIYNATLDGPIYGINGMASGIGVAAKAGVTLLNGAALTDGGTLGTNLLQN